MTKHEDEQQAKKSVRSLVDFVNGYNSEDLAKILLSEVSTSHRTLQQSFIGGLKLFVEKYADLDPGMYMDLRNMEAHRWAARVQEMDAENGTLGLRMPLI